jgi:peptidoglycan-associated lipoprotein
MKRSFLALGIMVLSLSLMGCPKKPGMNPDEGANGSGEIADTDLGTPGLADSDSNNAMGMQTVFFPFDSFEIVGENRDALKNNIKIMKENPNVTVQIEGHCDERGGIQYNLALGEKRAGAIKQQMVAAGVAGSRITTISMGKEKPLVMGTGEDVWAKNRRGNFVITGR